MRNPQAVMLKTGSSGFWKKIRVSGTAERMIIRQTAHIRGI